jgi:DNA repair protein RadC
MSTSKRFEEEVLPKLVQIISEVDSELLFQVSLDGCGDVLDIECLASGSQSRMDFPANPLLERPRDLNASSVVYVSSTREESRLPHDVEFTARLIHAGTLQQIFVSDHYIVVGGVLRSLRSTTSLWK